MEKHNDVTIAGGHVYNFYTYNSGNFVSYGGTLEIKNNTIIHNIGENYGFLDGAEIVDIVLNFWIARTSEFLDGSILYNPELKIGFEHEDFFIRVKANKKKVVLMGDVYIQHHQDNSYKTYAFYRRVRAIKYCQKFLISMDAKSLKQFFNGKLHRVVDGIKDSYLDFSTELYPSEVSLVENYLSALHNKNDSQNKLLIFNSLKFLFSKYNYFEKDFSDKKFFNMYKMVMSTVCYEHSYGEPKYKLLIKLTKDNLLRSDTVFNRVKRILKDILKNILNNNTYNKLLNLYNVIRQQKNIASSNFNSQVFIDNEVYVIENNIRTRIYDLQCLNGLEIFFYGVNNILEIELPITFTKSEIFMGSNNFFSINSTSHIIKALHVNMRSNGSSLTIGSDVIIMDGVRIVSHNGKNIEIGNDCLMATNITIRNSDGHTISDKNNIDIILNEAKDVFIGNHVWLAEGVVVSKGSIILDNSVVGCNSFVNKRFNEPNIIIAGSPAVVVKKEIMWQH